MTIVDEFTVGVTNGIVSSIIGHTPNELGQIAWDLVKYKPYVDYVHVDPDDIDLPISGPFSVSDSY